MEAALYDDAERGIRFSSLKQPGILRSFFYPGYITERAVQKALHLFCFNIEKILIKYLKYSRHLDYILNHFCYASDAFLEQIIKVRST